jgi:hypothetical protein
MSNDKKKNPEIISEYIVQDPLAKTNKDLDKGSGAAGYISSDKTTLKFFQKDQETLQLFVPNSKRLGSYAQ